MPDNPTTLPEPLRPLAVDAQAIETLADAAFVHADVQAIADVVNDAQRAVRARLDELAFADADGSGVTRRYDVGQVIVTDPKPKPKIVEPAAFEAWVELTTNVETVRRPRIDVLDAAAALTSLRALADHVRAVDAIPGEPVESPPMRLDALRGLLSAVAFGEETLVPATALDDLVAGGRIAVLPDRAVDTETGEAVPGVEVTRGAPAVQVKPDKGHRAAAAAIVRANLAGRAEVTS